MTVCLGLVLMTFTSEEHYHVSGVWNYCPGCGRKVVKRD